MAQSQVFIYLPSSVKTKLYDNKISHFVTEFSAPILLNESFDYEAAILKVLYPTSIQNVYNGSITYFSFAAKKMSDVSIPTGSYSPEEIVVAFNKTMGADNPFYKLALDKDAKKFYLQLNSSGGIQPQMLLGNDLQAFLGMPPMMNGNGKYNLTPYDLTAGLSAAYLYTDLTSYISVGDTRAPLLCVFTLNTKDAAPQLEYQPSKPLYIPVTKNLISDIKIEIRGRTGVFIPFESGEIVCLIHIRPRLINI